MATERSTCTLHQPAEREGNEDETVLHKPIECVPELLLRALQASEARWRDLIENTQDWVWEVDSFGCYTYASPRVEAILGYTPAEVLGKTPFDFMPAAERERVFADFMMAVADRAPFQGLENTNRRKDGSLVVLETNGVPFFDEKGDLAGYRGIDRDITERKRIETALRRKSEELEAMFSNTRVLIAVLDKEFNFVRVNPGYAAMAGKDADWLIGRNHFELYPHEENNRLFRQVVESGEPFSITAKPFDFPDQPELGTTYWDWMLTPIRSESGGVEGVILTLVDATERERQRRAAEVVCWQAQAQLEQRVRERTEALEAVNREMEAFSYAVSHDLRAPLRAINGFSKAMQEDCAGSLDDQGRMYLERIRKATSRMSEFIDGLLVLSLVSRTELQKRQIDLSALAHDFIDQLRMQEPGRIVDLHIEPDLTTLGDPALLLLLIQNLLANAWKFTAHRPVATIHFGRTVQQNREVLFIRDNGAGFPKEHAAKLFQPFTRLHGVDEFEGNGIGLMTVRRIVERHGGTVWAEGEAQNGATFFFSFTAAA